MPLETASHIADLNASNPVSGDPLSQTDDHLRLIKTVLTTDLATINGPVTSTLAQINSLGAMIKTDSDLQGSLVTTGTATAYLLTSNTVFASLSAMNGKVVVFKAHVTSGASPTLNVDSLGAVALKSIAGTAIPTGALLIGGIYAATYNNSATEFVVHGIFGVLPSFQVAGALTVQSGGLTVTAGGLLVTAGGATITAGGLTVTAGGLTVTASGAAITGNSTITGTLGLSSDLAINTNKFTVAAASGNTLVAGTLGVAGLVTASAGLTVSSGAVALPAGSVADAALVTGPQRVLLATLTASNSVSLNDTTSLTATYENYEIVFTNVLPATSNVQGELQVYVGGVLKTTGYLSDGIDSPTSGVSANAGTTTFIALTWSAAVGNNAGGFSGNFRVNKPSSNDIHVFYGKTGFLRTGGAIFDNYDGAGCYTTAGAVDGIKFFFSSGNITSGTIKIYGLN